MTNTEVLVIGAGPAGIMAASAAAENGRRVIVLDDKLLPGGQIWRDATAGSGSRDDAPKRRAMDRLRRSGAQVRGGCSVFTAAATGTVKALQESGADGSVEEIGFEQLILATGARERFLPFPGWTLPGVFGAGGLQAMARGGFPVANRRVVIAGTGPLLLAVAAHLAEDGAVISSVVEQAPLAQLAPFTASLWSQPAKLIQGARFRAKLWTTPYRTGCWVVRAIAASDGQKLEAVHLTDGKRVWTESCDLLAYGYHLVPNTEIAELLGCELRGGFVQVNKSQRTSLPNVFCAGEPTGIAGLEAALVQGEIAGLACAGRDTSSLQREASAARAFGGRMDRAFALRNELRLLPRRNTIVCRCEDVSFESLRNHTGWTDAKLQTRCGMGACQGRVCGPAVEYLLGWKPVSVRQPIFPVPMQAFCSQSKSTEINNMTELIEENR